MSAPRWLRDGVFMTTWLLVSLTMALVLLAGAFGLAALIRALP